MILAFEQQYPQRGAHKDQLIRDLLRMTPGRYYQRLYRACESADGRGFAPALADRVLGRSHRPAA